MLFIDSAPRPTHSAIAANNRITQQESPDREWERLGAHSNAFKLPLVNIIKFQIDIIADVFAACYALGSSGFACLCLLQRRLFLFAFAASVTVAGCSNNINIHHKKIPNTVFFHCLFCNN